MTSRVASSHPRTLAPVACGMSFQSARQRPRRLRGTAGYTIIGRRPERPWPSLSPSSSRRNRRAELLLRPEHHSLRSETLPTHWYHQTPSAAVSRVLLLLFSLDSACVLLIGLSLDSGTIHPLLPCRPTLEPRRLLALREQMPLVLIHKPVGDVPVVFWPEAKAGAPAETPELWSSLIDCRSFPTIRSRGMLRVWEWSCGCRGWNYQGSGRLGNQGLEEWEQGGLAKARSARTNGHSG